jgi:hypothetical protein
MISVFSSSKCSLFHNSNVFGSCIIHILYTVCAKIKKKIIPEAKRLIRILKIQAASSIETSATHPTVIRLYQSRPKYILLRQTFHDLQARSI